MNEMAKVKDTACMSMTSMFLAKMVDNGDIEYGKRKRLAEQEWTKRMYYDPVRRQRVVWCGLGPAPANWRRV